MRRFATPQYVVAVLAVAMATGLRLTLDPLFGAQIPYLPFIAAILFSGRVGGRGSALVSTLLSGISVWYLFLEPRFSFSVKEPSSLIGLALFFAVGVAISLMDFRGSPALAPVQPHETPQSELAWTPSVVRIAMLTGGVLAIGVLASLLLSGMRRAQDAQQLIQHTYRVLNAASSSWSSLEDAETSQRGYLLTGDNAYLQTYRAAVVAEGQALASLRRLVSDNPVQQARLREFDQLSRTRLELLAATLRAGSLEGSAAMMRTSNGRELMDRLHALLDDVDAEEHRLLQQRSEAASLADSRTRWILGLGSCSLVVVLLLSGVALERHIQERKLAEEELARQARLIDLSNDAIITADGGRIITGWNSGAEQMYGWTAREAVGKRMHELLRTSSTITIPEIDAILAKQDRWEGELHHTRADGRQIVTESRQVQVRGESSQPGGILEINRDITARRQAEQALSESEEQFRTLANAIPQLCWMANGDGWIFWYNQRWFEYTGTTQEQMQGWEWKSVHDPDVLPSVMERWTASIATGTPFDMVFPLRGADGAFRPFLTRVMPVRDREGKVVRWFGTNTDIGEQLKTEEALRRSRAKLEAALSSMTDAVFISDAEGHFLQFNEAFATFHKFGSMEECSRTFAEYPAILDVSFPDGTPAPVDMWPMPRALRGESATGAEYLLRRKDSGESWAGSYSFGPIRDHEGAIAGSVVVAHDITDRKRREEEIRRLNADLEQRVLERTAQLASSNKELEAFAYSVSHDLRAPLRGIDGWSLALMEDYSGSLEPRALEYLARVRSETQRMGHLIDGLLQLSRITRSDMHRDRVNLSGIAESIALRLREAHPERRLEFIVRPGMTAVGDGRLLEIALTNLLHNAVKFTGLRAQARIEFRIADCHGEPAYAVGDNGVGFDMAYAGTLFGAFQRLHSDSEFPGTGIGLATVQRVVHRHGGRIWAEAAPDRGATFFFTLGPDQ